MAEDTAPTARASRGRRRREQTRRELLSAARRVLARHGFHRTKIVDIAREAKIAVGTFYLYYPTKQALFLELVADTVHLLKAEIDRAHSANPDPSAHARAGCETFFRFAQQHRELFRIVFGHGATFHGVVRKAQELFVNDIAANIANGMRIGIFRPNRPEIVAQAFVGMSLQVASWWIEQDDIPLSQITDALLQFVFQGLGASPAAL